MVRKKLCRKPTGGKRQASAAQRQAQALALRAQGRTFEQIAQALGYANRGGAYKAVCAGLRGALIEPASELLVLEHTRLEDLWQIAYQQAQGGDLQAVIACLRVSESRRRLWGLDKDAQLTVGAAERLIHAVTLSARRFITDETEREEFAAELLRLMR